MMSAQRRLVLAVLTIAVPVSASAGEFAQAPQTPGMALTLPEPGMANSEPDVPSAPGVTPAQPQTDPAEGHRRLRALGGGFPTIAGQLPNQRTGSRHQHVVRDICIGC